VFGPRADGRGHAVYFGDTGANVYALDAGRGSLIWTRQVDRHPLARVTGSPVLDGGRLYVPVSSLEETAAAQPGYECCTFRGSIAALAAATGEPVWQTYTAPPAKVVGTNAAGTKLWAPSGVGVWSAPSIDRKRNVVYVTTGNTYSGTEAEATGDAILALDPETGVITWSKQLTAGDVFGCRAGAANCLDQAGPDFDFGTPAVLATTRDGRDVILLGQKSGIAYAIDPDAHGEVIWQYRAGIGSIWGGIQWGVATDGEHVFIPVSDIRTAAPGGLHALRLATGLREWYLPPPPIACTPGPGCNAALISAPTLIPGVLFSGSNDGAIRAHDVADGSVIWEFDTNREFTTVNGVRANGGSIQGAGPTVTGGMVYFNAGYGDHMGRPGNVLLAFGVK
jgi:polyvinyl alcohol dehydrogenase (cytochrome)